jgi:hypothetical protein
MGKQQLESLQSWQVRKSHQYCTSLPGGVSDLYCTVPPKRTEQNSTPNTAALIVCCLCRMVSVVGAFLQYQPAHPYLVSRCCLILPAPCVVHSGLCVNLAISQAATQINAVWLLSGL